MSFFWAISHILRVYNKAYSGKLYREVYFVAQRAVFAVRLTAAVSADTERLCKHI